MLYTFTYKLKVTFSTAKQTLIVYSDSDALYYMIQKPSV